MVRTTRILFTLIAGLVAHSTSYSDQFDFVELFGPAEIVSIGLSNYSVEAGDIDGDGDLDLVAPNFHPAFLTVSILRNNGDGTFAPFEEVDPQGRPWVARLVDIDHDGDLDLLASVSFGTEVLNGITVLLNDGLGNFTFSGQYATNGQPEALAIGDLNLDGHLDCVATGVDTGTITVLYGDGNSGFRDSDVRFVAQFITGVIVADLNGDGWPDVAATNAIHPNITIFLNDQLGILLKRSTVLEFMGAPGGAATLAADDLDHDGDIDLAFGPGGLHKLVVFRNDSTGSFENFALIDYGTDLRAPVEIHVTDFNRDGRIDLALAHADSNAVTVWAGSESGAFEFKQVLTGFSDPWSLASGDLDGDGDVDLAVAQTQVALMRVHFSNLTSEKPSPDLTGDGVVDGRDLAELLAQWGASGPGDLNLDGVTDGADLSQLLSKWGAN